MRPHILLTVYRRYELLSWNIDCIFSMLDEFALVPSVTLVWAQPEDSMRGFIENLGVDRIIYRDKLPLEGECLGGISYPESHNLRLGMTEIKKTANSNDYIIVQTADMFANRGIYKKIDELIPYFKAIVWNWPNVRHNRNNFAHTNFFAVGMDENYWPPVSGIDHPEVLEAQWFAGGEPPFVCRRNTQDFFTSHETDLVKKYLNGNP